MEKCQNLTSKTLFYIVHIYRMVASPILGGSCRFYPSCSSYALDALRMHNPGSALILITKRLGRCRPGGPFGYDPVPDCQCEEMQKHAK